MPKDGEPEPVSIRRMAMNYADRLQAIRPAFSAGLITTGAGLNEDRILEHILRTNRIDVSAISGPLTHQRADELLRQQSGVEFPLPPRELLELMVRSVNINQDLLRHYVPNEFDGDMVIFTAIRNAFAAGGAVTTRLLGMQTRLAARIKVRRWRRHVTGDVTAHSVDCTHHDRLNTASLQLYGDQLRRALDS